MVTVAVQEAVWPVASSAVIMTLTVPAPAMVPAAGDWESVKVQPVATTSFRSDGITASQSAFAVMVLFEAHVVIVGAPAARTVTVNPQVSPVPEQVTAVLPTGKAEPDAGTHVTVPQVPLVVGAG